MPCSPHNEESRVCDTEGSLLDRQDVKRCCIDEDDIFMNLILTMESIDGLTLISEDRKVAGTAVDFVRRRTPYVGSSCIKEENNKYISVASLCNLQPCSIVPLDARLVAVLPLQQSLLKKNVTITIEYFQLVP